MNSQPPTPETEAADFEWRERIISEIFHVISQPLTGLHCLLEVSLMKKQTAVGYRRDIQSALEATSRVVDSLRQARELAEADNPGNLQTVDLAEIVSDVADEFQPILEASHIRTIPSLKPGSFVSADPAKLRLAIFYLFDALLYDLPLGCELSLEIESAEAVIFSMRPRGQDDPTCSPRPVVTPASRSVALAKTIVAAMHGQLAFSASPAGNSFQLKLPHGKIVDGSDRPR